MAKLYASAIGLRYTFGVRLNVGCENKNNTLGLGFIEHPFLLREEIESSKMS